MTLTCIQNRAKQIKALRFELAAQEQRLGLEIWKYLKDRGSMRELARQLHFSPQYICDISHGKRKISQAFLEKVVKL